MGKSAGKAPTPVDPTVVANAQSKANKDSAQYQQQLNMVGATGPGGSVKYVKDPTQPGGYTQVTELDPGQQSLYNLGVNAQTGALNVANDQIGRLGTALGRELTAPNLRTSVGPTDFTADRNAITDAVYGRYKSRLDPQWQQAEDRERNRLSNQGLSQNSTAYGTAMGDFSRGRNDAYDQALTSAILAGSDEQQRLFGQSMDQANFGNNAAQQGFQNDAYVQSKPIQDFSALLGMGNITMPTGYTGPQTSVNGTDVLGAFGLQAQQQQNAYNARQAKANSANQGIGQLAGSALSTAIMLSDARVKKDISWATKANGHNLYFYRHIDEPSDAPLRLGVMAQEVAQTRPDAVLAVGDLLAVDYGKLFQTP